MLVASSLSLPPLERKHREDTRSYPPLPSLLPCRRTIDRPELRRPGGEEATWVPDGQTWGPARGFPWRRGRIADRPAGLERFFHLHGKNLSIEVKHSFIYRGSPGSFGGCPRTPPLRSCRGAQPFRAVEESPAVGWVIAYLLSLHEVTTVLSAGLKPRSYNERGARPSKPEKHCRRAPWELVRKRLSPGSAGVSPASHAGRRPALPERITMGEPPLPFPAVARKPSHGPMIGAIVASLPITPGRCRPSQAIHPEESPMKINLKFRTPLERVIGSQQFEIVTFFWNGGS